MLDSCFHKHVLRIGCGNTSTENYDPLQLLTLLAQGFLPESARPSDLHAKLAMSTKQPTFVWGSRAPQIPLTSQAIPPARPPLLPPLPPVRAETAKAVKPKVPVDAWIKSFGEFSH